MKLNMLIGTTEICSKRKPILIKNSTTIIIAMIFLSQTLYVIMKEICEVVQILNIY